MQQNGHGRVKVNSVIWLKLAFQVQHLSKEDKQRPFVGAEYFQTAEYTICVEIHESQM
jgi:hypothetical protein